MAKCEICGKGNMIGHNIRHKHSGLWEKRASKTLKIFKPNVHKGWVLMKGAVKRVTACASCLTQFRAPKKVKKAA